MRVSSVMAPGSALRERLHGDFGVGRGRGGLVVLRWSGFAGGVRGQVEQLADVRAGDGLAFEQGVRELVEAFALFGEDLRGAVLALADDAFDLVVDLAEGLLAAGLVARDVASEVDVVGALAVLHGA